MMELRVPIGNGETVYIEIRDEFTGQDLVYLATYISLWHRATTGEDLPASALVTGMGAAEAVEVPIDPGELADLRDLAACAHSSRQGIKKCPGGRPIVQGLVCVHCGHDTSDGKCKAPREKS